MISTNNAARQRAIVIGGSIAGLSAAEVLSQYFDRVTVIERDRYPEGEALGFRKGVPQGRQPHALLKRGLLELERIFPGFTEDWKTAGAVPINFGHEVEWFAFGGWRPRYEPGLTCYASTRPLIEGVIRNRVKANPKVEFCEATEVVGLTTDKSKKCVTGVRIRSRDDQQMDVLEGRLVVDASGRESHTPDWLVKLGLPQPQRTIVNAFPGYASRLYERPAGYDGKIIYIQPDPSNENDKRGAMVQALENNQLHVVILGMSGDYPPTGEEEYKSFLSGLSNKEAYEVVKNAIPLTQITGYRNAENIWHHYERESRWPENFIVIGDAYVAFNPVYGQGMTAAALGAGCLMDVLQGRENQSSLIGFSKQFQKQLAKVQAFPWQLATGEDMRWSPATEGISPTPSPSEKVRLNFLKKVMVASTKDPVVTDGLYQVMNMVASPSLFFRPNMLTRVLRAS